MVIQMTSSLSTYHWIDLGACIWLSERLLEPNRKLLQFFISLV